MFRQQAEVLAQFVNGCSKRYRAEALPLGTSEAWVLLTDRMGREADPAPIADVTRYLNQADPRQLSPECRELLEAWLLDEEVLLGEELLSGPAERSVPPPSLP